MARRECERGAQARLDSWIDGGAAPREGVRRWLSRAHAVLALVPALSTLLTLADATDALCGTWIAAAAVAEGLPTEESGDDDDSA
eukprot:3013676-Pleurochrysis_carterae.AAC.1